jgi:lipid II:glycine glycyltransferase (peptidoglycan interpeptide bridge formation enzyme)
LKLISEKEIDPKEWEGFFNSNSFKTPFQNKQFYDLFNSVEGFKAKVFAVKANDKIEALCVVTFQREKGIKGYFSRRGIIYGGPLLTDNKKAALELLKHLATELKEAIYIETRNFKDYSDYKKEFSETGWDFEPYLNYHLNCTSEELVWKNLNTNRQRQIKKAFKSGVVLEEAKTETDVKGFHNILNQLYKTKIKKPVFSLEFFQKFVHNNTGKIFLVKYQNKIIGGIACPVLEGNSIYELYICGLDNEYKDCSPSVMATYAAIQYGFKKALNYFDFMGAGKPEEDYGVRSFKEKFGGELVKHGRYIKVNDKLLYGLGKKAIGILSKKKSKTKN